MNEENRRDFHSALSENAATCEAVAERTGRYSVDNVSIEAAEIITAILALTEAVRILAQVQMYRGQEVLI